MANPYFAFKQFTINHDKCAMKVGTDGVLLGAWVNVQDAKIILDAGTGTGLIAIMMAQRCNAIIDAVELDENAYIQAMENVKACPWNDRIRIRHDSFQHFAGITPYRYEVIVSNPPFFRNSLKPPVKARSLARHDDNLNYESLLYGTSQLLTPEGRLAIIVPANEIAQVADSAYLHGLYPSELLMIRSLPGKDYSRCLAEFTRNRNRKCIKNDLLIKLNNAEDFSDDYKAMLKDYYLKI
jgi:tRNA1Val (adenine37-N6)-methyltransferase